MTTRGSAGAERSGGNDERSPMIDIMLPFYGREDHFREAVGSVLAQDTDRWRLTIIDDANPDPAPGRWAAGLDDPRITFLRHAENAGINRTFQECLEHSRAEWVVVFGCDDVMEPGYVRRVSELAARHPEAGIIQPGTSVIDGDGRAVRPLVDIAKGFYRPAGPKPHVLAGEDLAVSITRGNWMTFPSLAWHGPTVRSIGFRPGYDVVQDLALALDVCRTGRPLVLDDEVVFRYRRHAGSVSSWRAADGTRFAEERAFFRAQADDFAARGWSRAARAARTHLSSRINALTRMPSAVRARDTAGTRELWDHLRGAE